MKERLIALITKLKTVRKTYLVVGISLIVLVILLLVTINVTNSQKQQSDEKQLISDKSVVIKRRLLVGTKEILAEVAATPQERSRGLMYRTQLDENSGMLFTFGETAEYPFWMKNMKISIDIIWIDENQNVVDMDQNAPPCAQESCELYTPTQPIKYVLEVPAGWAQRNGVQNGTYVEFKDSIQELVDPPAESQ